MMPAPVAPVHIERVPFSREGVERLLAIDPGAWHVQEGYLRRWLGEESPFLAYGKGHLLFAGGDGALAVTFNPRAAEPHAGFAFLRLRPGGADVTPALMAEARAFARENGARELVGPLAFSTWHPYRALAPDRPALAPAFPGEGVEPPTHDARYRAAGLDVIERYVSCCVPPDPVLWEGGLAREAAIAARRPGHSTVRELNAAEGPALVPELHAMLHEAFAHARLFAPIEPAELAELLLNPPPAGIEAMYWGAFAPDGRLTGVCAGLRLGGQAVLRTLAVRPGFQGGRAAMALTFAFHRALHAHGATQVVHAMMKADNVSASMSAKYATPVRHYVLYGSPVDRG